MIKRLYKKLSLMAIAILVVFSVSSCGATFNTIGITMGNIKNTGQVTSQNGTTFFIGDDGIYKTKDKIEDAKRILKGDFNFLNIVGENIFYYDNTISTICTCSTIGDNVKRIAELYTDNFVVIKDNILGSVLTGVGDEDMTNPDDYNIVKLKITDNRVGGKAPKTFLTKAKLEGCIGDTVYVEKNSEGKRFIFSYSLDATSEKKLFELPQDGKFIGNSNGLYLLGTVDGIYGIYKYKEDGKLDKKLVDVGKNLLKSGNAINIDNDYIYYEDYSQKVTKKTKKKKATKKIVDNLLRISVKGGKGEVIIKNSEPMKYYIAQGSKDMLYKVTKANDLDTIPQWQVLKE